MHVVHSQNAGYDKNVWHCTESIGGGAYLLHGMAHTCYFLKDHVYNIHHWSDDIATPPFMHMVGLEPRFHQCMTHILPIYLWVE